MITQIMGFDWERKWIEKDHPCRGGLGKVHHLQFLFIGICDGTSIIPEFVVISAISQIQS
jgi:hypothetical protein